MSEERTDVAREVKAGGETYTIGKFKGYKAFRIGRMLTSLGEIGPEISKKTNEFVVEYRKQNVDVIERATLEFRYPSEAAGVSDEAWKESNGVIRLANDPSQAEILAIVFPAAFDLAGDRVVDLLAWVIASDADLEQKDGESEEAVAEYIKGLRKRLLFNCNIDELFDLAAAATEVLRDQLAGKAEQARGLLALVGLGQEDSEEEEPETEDRPETEGQKVAEVTIEEPTSTAPEPKVETPTTQASPTTSPRPASSTDSPAPTDGGEETSSTARAGALSSSTSD